MYCKDCNYRKNEYCHNPKIHEKDRGEDGSDEIDHLIYSYDECGGFWVGEKFGCIHFMPKTESPKKVCPLCNGCGRLGAQ